MYIQKFICNFASEKVKEFTNDRKGSQSLTYLHKEKEFVSL